MRNDLSWLSVMVLGVAAFGCGDDDGTSDDAAIDMGPVGTDMAPLDDGFVPPDATCPLGMTGADCTSCAAGYQDGDGDGTCTLGCDAAGADELSCGAHGTCADDTGTRECVCDEGYTGTGSACDSCEAGWTAMGTECALTPGVMTGLRLWYDASDAGSVVTNDSGEVMTLSSRVGSFPLVSPSGLRPVLEADVFNGRPAIRFSSSARVASTGSTDALAGDDYEIFVVAGPVGLTPGRALLSTRTGTSYGTILETASAGYRFVHRSPAGVDGGDAVVTTRPAEQPHLIRVARNGSGTLTVLQMRVADGANLSANEDTTVLTTAAVGTSQAFVLGSGPTDFNGHIAEVLVFDRVLSATEFGTVGAYLRAKWGI